jgi:hypothetical protein
LAPRDISGKSDPYVKISIGHDKPKEKEKEKKPEDLNKANKNNASKTKASKSKKGSKGKKGAEGQNDEECMYLFCITCTQNGNILILFKGKFAKHYERRQSILPWIPIGTRLSSSNTRKGKKKFILICTIKIG